jgi:signal transduction histidine kinase
MRWVVIAASVVGIGLGLQLILIAVPVLPGPLARVDVDPIGRFWAFAPVVVIALVLAIARTISFARASVLDELRATNSELTWEVARIRLNLWAQQRQFAQAIHGPLQAAITSSALLLSQSGEFDRVGAIEAARNRITSALDRVTGHEEPAADWTTGFAEIERTWAGVCEVLASVDADAARMLDRDDTCRQAAVMVIGESVANSAIHGKATRVDVYADMVHERFIRITINDNGQGIDAAANTGLGSAILDDTCGEWELKNTGHGARLTAVLAAASPVNA